MNLLRIFFKSIIEQIRDWRFLAYALFTPILFMVVFGIAFNSGYYTYKVGIFNYDQGALFQGETTHLGNELIDLIRKEHYSDESKVFEIIDLASEKIADKKAMSNSISCYITIPEDFTNILIQARQDGKTGSQIARVAVKGSAGNPKYGVANMIFSAIFNDFITEKTNLSLPAARELFFLGEETKESEFDYLAPGIMIMAIFTLIIQSAVIFMKDIEGGAIVRLQLARIKVWDLIGGLSLTQILFALIMVPIMFATAIAVGFNVGGSLLSGMIIGIFASISAIGLGLITAAFSRTSTEAFLIGNFVLIPVVFLSGVFFPLPDKGINLFGETISLFQLQPATHAVNAFQKIFLKGSVFTDVLFEVVMLVILSVIFFIVGMLLYKHSHFKIYKTSK